MLLFYRRARVYLLLYSFLHVLAGCALSLGFTVYIHKTYYHVFELPVAPAWQEYCPPFLEVRTSCFSHLRQLASLPWPQELCSYSQNSLMIQQMMYFLGVGEWPYAAATTAKRIFP